MKLFINKIGSVGGTVNISGAKNSAVAIIPAATLTNKKVTLTNIPNIQDVDFLIKTLNHQGFKTIFNNNTLIIKRKLFIKKTFKKHINKLRGSYYFIGAFLARFKKIKFGNYGGCNLGERPINYHNDAFKKMNTKIKNKKKYTLYKTKELQGADITLPFPSVGATINILIASTLSKGITTITNASFEPEVIDVGNFLKKMGANIIGLGTQRISIIGVKKLHGCTHKIISDRIEAATYLAIGATTSTRGVTVKNVNTNHLKNILFYFEKMGCKLNINTDSITIFKPLKYNDINIKTGPYPFFPTDLNPIFCSCLLKTNNESTITETIYENRISHINELKKMGANIIQKENITYIYNSNLKPASLTAHDLRCAASLLIAGLQIKCPFEINNIEYLLRGYEEPVNKLKQINIHTELIS